MSGSWRERNLAVMGAVFLFCISSALAGDLEPPGPPTSGTMKTLSEVEPRTAIGPDTTPGGSDCLYHITEPGSYYLKGNILCNFKHAIRVEARNVTIDLMGFEIRSSWLKVPPDAETFFDGIYIVPDSENVTVRNGSIFSNTGNGYRGFRRGIYIGSHSGRVQGVTVERVTVTACREDGIRLEGEGHRLYRVTSTSNSGRGIYAWTATVEHCIVTDSGSDGVYLGLGSDISDSRVGRNGGYGINLNSLAVASRNIVTSNHLAGIYAWHNAIILDNQISFNNLSNDGSTGTEDPAGIYCMNYSVVKDNRLASNRGTGIYVDGVNAVVESNVVVGLYNSSVYGIRIVKGSNFYASNRANFNQTDYSVVAGNTDGGDNVSF